MAYLFDTNHCIYLMNGWNKDPNRLSIYERNTVESFSRMDNEVVYMSEASVGELFYGIEKSGRKEHNLKKFKAFQSAVPPIPVNMGVWEIYGRTKAELSNIGRVIPDIDLLIASTAKFYDMILVANDKHMRHLPNSFVRENWAEI